MTASSARPSPTISDPFPGTAAEAFEAFEALSPLRRDVLLGHLAGLDIPALAERVDRSSRDTVSLLVSSLQCWADLLTAAGTASGSDRATVARMAAGTDGLRGRDRRRLVALLPPGAAAELAGIGGAGPRRRAAVVVGVASAVVLAATSAAVVLTHRDQERTDSPTASAGPEAADGAAAPAGRSAGSPVGSERAPTVIAGSRLVPAADGAVVRGEGPAAGATSTSTSTSIGQVPVATDPDSGDGGGPDDGGSADPLGIEVDPGSGRVRIVLVLPGGEEPIVIETPAAER